jgi:hypothetical protein
MTPKEFVIWLDGYLQGNGDVGLTTMQVRDLINKIAEVDLTDKEKNIIIERVERPTNPIRIGEPPYGNDDDFPGKPNKVYM